MQSLILHRISQERRLLQQMSASAMLAHPERILDRPRQRVTDVETKLDRLTEKQLDATRAYLSERGAALEAMSPLATLARGYASVSKDGKTLSKAADVAVGDVLKIRFADGVVCAGATEIEGARKNHAEENNDL